MCASKILYGTAFLLVGIWLLLPSEFFGMGMWKDLLGFLKGLIPISLALTGIILIWIETDEKRMEKIPLVLTKPKKKKQSYKSSN